jgi:TM2 domain-containing membrane protein YozV
MSKYFVRSRGKVTGPFQMGDLQQLVKRGRLNRFDQISSDNSSWGDAGNNGDLFAVAGARGTQVVAGADPHNETHKIESDTPPHSSTRGHLFFYAQNGSVIGPVSPEVLQSLATNGTLQADDQVWAEGSNKASTAMQLPMLAALYSRQPLHNDWISGTRTGSRARGKSRLAATLFAFFLGGLGIHKFYLGAWGWGILYIVFFITGIPALVALVEGIIFCCTSQHAFDEKYNFRRVGAFTW